MSKLAITATGEIPRELLLSFIDEVGKQNCHEPGRVVLLSTQPPSYIEIVGSLITWQTVVVASTTVFFSTLAKRLADDIYDKKTRIADGVFYPVKQLARSMMKMLNAAPRNPHLIVEIEAPSGIPNPSLFLTCEPEDEIAFKLSCFYAVGDQIIDQLTKISTEYKGKLTPPKVQVSESGEIAVQCYAGMNNELIEFKISLLG